MSWIAPSLEEAKQSARNASKATRPFELMKEAAARARRPFDKDILLNLAFFMGQQYVEWHNDGLRVIPRREGEKHAPRPVSNKIMHFVASQHSNALSSKPVPDTLPASEDPQDISIASVALNYLKSRLEPQVTNFQSKLSTAVWWALAAGEGYLKWTYDANKKQPVITARSPLDVYIDPYCVDFADARYIIDTQFMDTEQVYDAYGKEVKPTAVSRADQSKAALLSEIGQAPVLQGVVVNELWLKPGGRRFPKGLFVAWTTDEILYWSDEFPYKHGHLPYTILGSIPRIGTPHYTCAVKFMRIPQMELNKFHAQRIQVRTAFSNPKWWVPDELELHTPIDDSPSQVLRGSAASGLAPAILQPAVFPDNGDGEWLVSEMQDIVGLHEVSQAGVPGRVEAAKAIEILKESDDSRLAELTDTIETALSEGGWQILMLAKQFEPAEQIVQTYSREGLPEVKAFKASDLKEGIRVQVMMGTGLSKSRVARADQAILLWQNGIITDPELMSEIMEIPLGRITPQKAFDIRLARNENLTMASGEHGVAIVPNSWDDHAIHIREHNNFRKTAEYEALDQETKTKFEFHVETHHNLELEVLAREAQKMQLMQMAQGGGQSSGVPADGAEVSTAPSEAVV